MDYITKLTSEKKKAEIRLQQAERDLLVIESLFKRAYEEGLTNYVPQFTQKSSQALHISNCIKKLLRANEAGLATSMIERLLGAYYDIDVNSNTLRSYLFRMSGREIYQGKDGNWFLMKSKQSTS